MINGVRMAFSHVDGDAFMGFTELRPDSVCADVMYDRIFSKYSLPFTVSVIVAEVDPELDGSQQAFDLARKIYKLPNVEAASHTFTHPYIWNPNAEVEDEFYGRHGYNIPGYDFDAETEIAYSTKWIEDNLTPEGKPCKILLWSGDCAPLASQVAIARKAGILQMNGGDTVYDTERNSLFNVAPPYRYVGGEYQIFTGQANENILTNLWHGPYFGYRDIVETMKRTGSPRLLSPVNPYYHFYSAEKEASLDALDFIYAWMQKQDLAHVYASDWIRSVQGFIAGKVLNPEPNHYIFKDFGECRTVRFDAGAPTPDMAGSNGVIGYRRTDEGLFVFFDPAVTEVDVLLQNNAPVEPHIEQASGVITDFSYNDDGVKCDYQGHAPGFVVIAGLEPDSEFQLTINGKDLGAQRSTGNGRVRLDTLPAGSIELQKR